MSGLHFGKQLVGRREGPLDAVLRLELTTGCLEGVGHRHQRDVLVSFVAFGMGVANIPATDNRRAHSSPSCHLPKKVDALTELGHLVAGHNIHRFAALVGRLPVEVTRLLRAV